MSTQRITNTELAAKIDVAVEEIKAVSSRVLILEDWKRNEDAFKAALKQVHDERVRKDNGSSDRLLNKELLKALGLALTAIISLVAIVQANK